MRQRITRAAGIAVALTAGATGPLVGSAQAADITPIPIPGSYVSITPIPIPYVTFVLPGTKLPSSAGHVPGGGIGPVSG